MSGNECLSGSSSERRLSREHLVQDAAEAVDVAASIDIGIRHPLLWTHVRRRTQRYTRRRQLLCSECAGGARNPEIGEESLPVLDKNVFGFNIAMHDAVAMRMIERACYLAGDAQCFVERELPLAIELGPQRFPLDVRHDVEQLA